MTDSNDYEFYTSREPWEWLDTPEWRWLTNANNQDMEYILKIEEMYGRKNVEVRYPAYGADGQPVPGNPGKDSSQLCGVFVATSAWEARQLTNPNSSDVPGYAP